MIDPNQRVHAENSIPHLVRHTLAHADAQARGTVMLTRSHLLTHTHAHKQGRGGAKRDFVCPHNVMVNGV